MIPIINPLYIYLISRLDNLKYLCGVTMGISAVAVILSILAYYYIRESTDSYYQSNYVKIQRDVLRNGERLRHLFDTYVCDLEGTMEEKDDQKKLKYLTEVAETCCSTLNVIKKEEVYLNEKVDHERNKSAIYKKIACIAFGIFCFALLIDVLIPSTTVGYQILAASYITPENLNLAQNTTKEAIEWIVQSIISAIQDMR